MQRGNMSLGFAMPKPGRALMGMLIAVGGIWVLLAIGLNWVGASQELVAPFIGDTSKVLHGQIWRLVTAPLIHLWTSPGHVLTTLLGLYFLGTPLETQWGPKRMLMFLFGSAAFAFALQALLGSLIPQLHSSVWFGGLGMVEAVAVAWALAFRGQTVRLFFVLPISSTGLLVFIFVMSVMNVISLNGPLEGHITPFGGMLAGWLFGSTSPLRRLWLQLRLRKYQTQVTAARAAAQGRRADGPPLRVIRGGSESPKDKRYLN